MTLLPFLEVSEGDVDVRRVFGVRSDRVKSQKTGREMTVDRLLVRDWVNVVAITDDDHMLFVRQWRFGTRQFTLELPAGVLEAGESPLHGGLRELREETGHAPSGAPAVVLGETHPNPAFMGNRCTTIFVPRAVVVGPQQLDPAEEVEVVRIPVSEVRPRLFRGEFSSALGLVALLWWLGQDANAAV